MFEALTARILRHSRVSGALLLVVTGFVIAGMAWLSVDFSVSSFFGRDDPETTYLDEYLERWGEDDLMIIAFDAGADHALLDRGRLERIDELADAIEGVEGIGGVVSLTRMPRAKRGVAGTWIPIPLLAEAPREGADAAKVERWRTSVLGDARLVPDYLSENGRYGSMLVALDVDTTDLGQVRPVVHRVEDLLEGLKTEGMVVHVAGVPAIRSDILDVVVGDQLVLAPLAGLSMAVLLFFLFRSRHGVLIPAVAAGVPIAMLLGVMGWTDERFGLLNQVYLVLVPAIAVADAIHFVSRYHEESRSLAGDHQLTVEQRNTAIIRAMGFMGVACFLTSFTTVVGFLSLLATDMQALRSFGAYAAVGVSFAYFTVLFIVPMALMFTRSGARKLSHGTEGMLGTVLETCAVVTTRFPALCVAAALVMGGFFAWKGTDVQVDTKITQSFAEDHPTTLGNVLVDDHLGGVMALEFDLAGPEGAFSEPEILAALGRAETYARKVDAVRSTASPSSILRATSVLVGGPDVVPTSPNVIRRLYSIAEDSAALAAMVKPERDRARVIIRVVDVGAQDFLTLGNQLSERFRMELGPLGVDAHLTGSSYVAYRGLARVTTDLRDSLMMAFGIIGIIIAVIFRSLALGMLSLLPNALPLLVGYGIMGLLGWTLEPAPAVVFTIAIGVTVDSAIHVIARFREERHKGRTTDEAIRDAIFHSGRAVVITAIILMMGFAVNSWSSSPANASFGVLGAIVVAGAILSNLLVLPALLKLLFNDRDMA